MQKIKVEDFPVIDFGDKRRDERFVTLINNISQQPGASIPRQNGSWYETKAAYNFFKNEEIKVDDLKKTIAGYGSSQVKDLDQLLIIHDITNVSYNKLQAEGLGYLDHGYGRGIMCYNTISATTSGLPLALMYQNCWVRPEEEMGKTKKRKTTNFEDKESYEWHKGISEVNSTLGKSIHKIHIADRQTDVYELFFCGLEADTDLLIRAHVNRKLIDGSPLWQHVASQPGKGIINLTIPDSTGKKKQTVEATVRYEKVQILRPLVSKAKYESVELIAIEVRQAGEVENEEDRIDWKLLTTLEVDCLADVAKYIKWYTLRWLIERFHYVLKSGTKIEHLQLKDATSLQKAIHLYSVAAFRIMLMVYLSRQYPEASCELVLTKAQWQTLWLLINKKEKLPEKVPCLGQTVSWIGRLGGHLGRKSDGPPGLKTVWVGYQRLCDATMVTQILIKNLGKE